MLERDHGGYSATPLARKLGLRPGMSVRLHDAPADYWAILGCEPEDLALNLLSPQSFKAADFQHVFARDLATLRRALKSARAHMASDGMIWVSWPKRSANPDAALGRADVFTAGKEAGLVDVKVCAVDATWSGLKWVIPVGKR